MPGKHPTAELYLQPLSIFHSKRNFFKKSAQVYRLFESYLISLFFSFLKYKEARGLHFIQSL